MTEVKNWGLEVEHRVIKSYTETQFCVIKRCFYRVDDGPCHIVLDPQHHDEGLSDSAFQSNYVCNNRKRRQQGGGGGNGSDLTQSVLLCHSYVV